MNIIFLLPICIIILDDIISEEFQPKIQFLKTQRKNDCDFTFKCISLKNDFHTHCLAQLSNIEE